jgi:hypothetical protein
VHRAAFRKHETVYTNRARPKALFEEGNVLENEETKVIAHQVLA